ncbi:unnamed protein product [Prunus armeniaca]|uniref:Uncharacterized protein n=1 Tax=Prunus armeniaca TaxID=36596 RepID=A0A6J5UD16_PRUAR|nr:hypothetical protein GBA52_010390 [Prunus armeniaca]CAB4273517.1 unnamed protein product [Prunus armeniaca]CAB4304037.1 unnamed protein product [Prunus armeniaca]
MPIGWHLMETPPLRHLADYTCPCLAEQHLVDISNSLQCHCRVKSPGQHLSKAVLVAPAEWFPNNAYGTY